MTVHARGYRTYSGPVRPVPGAIAIAREGIRTAWSRKAFRRIGVVYLAYFGMLAFFLYVSMGMDWFGFAKGVSGMLPASLNPSLVLLNSILQWYYWVVALLTALLAVLIGSPLISDDVQAGALPLYLVRPIRAVDYVIGKALVIPAILAVTILLPGAFFYLLMGVWQPPGEAWPFLTGNLDVLGRVLWHYGVSAALYTGLVLFVSSYTRRRAVAASLAGAVIFTGVMLRGVSAGLGATGLLSDVLRYADFPRDTRTVFLPYSIEAMQGHGFGVRPEESVVIVVAAVVLVLGLFAAWRRASSVEVTG